jgi:hypothetical protein
VYGGLTVVNHPFLYWLVVFVANSYFLRLKDEWRQGEDYRNEKAIEFQ